MPATVCMFLASANDALVKAAYARWGILVLAEDTPVEADLS